MGLVRRTSNRPQGLRNRRTHKGSWIHLSRLGVTASGVEMEGNASFSISGASFSIIRPGPMALESFTDNTGRAAKITIGGVGLLRQSTLPAHPASTFVMMKRQSIVMPTPTVDSKGKPE